MKANKPLKYRWEYLGEAIGSGVVPFGNLKLRKAVLLMKWLLILIISEMGLTLAMLLIR